MESGSESQGLNIANNGAIQQTNSLYSDMGKSDSSLESCKLFLGGLTRNTTKEMVENFYSQFGTVTDCIVMYNPVTGESRCFGFVSFSNSAETDRALANLPHIVDGSRPVDVKRAVPKSAQLAAGNPVQQEVSKYEPGRVFVSGVTDPDHTEANLRAYFEQFGAVKNISIFRGKTCAFIDFYDNLALESCLQRSSHTIENRRCDVKRAFSRQELARTKLQHNSSRMSPYPMMAGRGGRGGSPRGASPYFRGRGAGGVMAGGHRFAGQSQTPRYQSPNPWGNTYEQQTAAAAYNYAATNQSYAGTWQQMTPTAYQQQQWQSAYAVQQPYAVQTAYPTQQATWPTLDTSDKTGGYKAYQ